MKSVKIDTYRDGVNFWGKGLGYGVIIWIIMYAIAAIFLYYGYYFEMWVGILMAVIAGVVSYLFALSSATYNVSSALFYGFMWAIVGLVLDLIITRLTAPDIYYYWSYWLGYILIFLAPLLAIRRRVHVSA